MNNGYLDMDDAIEFNERSRKGTVSGVFSIKENRIIVYSIKGDKCFKGLMERLCNKFNTKKFRITPLINDNVENSIKGELKVLKHDDPLNPYGEEFKYMEGIFEI